MVYKRISLSKLALVSLISLSAFVGSLAIIPGVIDLSPRITPPVRFYISSSVTFDSTSRVFDAAGNVTFTLTRLWEYPGHTIQLQDSRRANRQKLLNLDSVNCTQNITSPIYFDTKTGGWTVEDATHKPEFFSSVYRRDSNSGIAGKIKVAEMIDYTEAEISGPQPGPSTLPNARYYILDISGDRGHDPFVKWEDAILLLVKLIQYNRLCEPHGSN
ncbi:hypothetical protein CROQUDRAFT_41439 [Cronartium quercuum f. sp. fusiforme G11]|uniref:Uncharacterized protein n=1 Tax=Cronartium quercuum f. sp. fusiforme G11 TaxID=708437 RepID=A0A9P6NQH4_9BASI|nr:hypothetical protein CROQUDRAFT_41439 [Cronartium quercuum f. sp. fusiforme G11]